MILIVTATPPLTSRRQSFHASVIYSKLRLSAAERRHHHFYIMLFPRQKEPYVFDLIYFVYERWCFWNVPMNYTSIPSQFLTYCMPTWRCCKAYNSSSERSRHSISSLNSICRRFQHMEWYFLIMITLNLRCMILRRANDARLAASGEHR